MIFSVDFSLSINNRVQSILKLDEGFTGKKFVDNFFIILNSIIKYIALTYTNLFIKEFIC